MDTLCCLFQLLVIELAFCECIFQVQLAHHAGAALASQVVKILNVGKLRAVHTPCIPCSAARLMPIHQRPFKMSSVPQVDAASAAY